MKKHFLIAMILIASPLCLLAQDKKEKDSIPTGWKTGGAVSLLFNQSAFNHEWTGGGTTNFAGNLKLNYDLNYRKNKLSWDTRLLVDYGLSKNRGDKYPRKTNDRLELNSILGQQIKESNWFYSFFVNLKTQATKGYKYDEDLNDTDPGYRTERTHFFSPANLQFGLGFLWKKDENLYVNIAPITSKTVFVDKAFTTVDENDQAALDAYNEDKYFGVDANKSHRMEFGTAISGYAKFDLMKNVSAENILNLYVNYLDKPQNIDVDYTLNLNMKVNDFITTNFTFQAIYDDNAAKGFQIRETLGVGVTYSF